jgi:LacI family transcriptional regulator
MATIRDVAHLAGVTPTTVSHVINSTRFVSENTAQRVLTAIKELNYQPNKIARSLRRKTTQTVGLVVPDNNNPFFAEVARGIEDMSFSRGYSVILCNSDSDLDKELSYIEVLLERQVDGIALVSAGLDSGQMNDLQERGKPLVVVDRDIAGIEIDCVLTDNRRGGYEAVRHLLNLGHRRIGCVSGPSRLTPSAERVSGYEQALTEDGLQNDEGLMVRGDFQAAGGYRAIEGLLSLSEPPTAAFVCNDMMAIGAIARAVELGVRVPRDLSIVGFDDIALASYNNPKLTTVAQPKYQMGTVAAEMLLSRMSNGESPMQKRVLSSELIIRHSTAPPGGRA